MNYNEPTKKKKKKKSGAKPTGSSNPTPMASAAPKPTAGLGQNPGSSMLNTVTITSPPVQPVVEEEEIVVIEPTPSTGVNPYKQLTRLSSDRNGQRAGFSSSVGRVVDEMQANTPERKKKRPRTTVEQVKRDWQMFKLPNEDNIS